MTRIKLQPDRFKHQKKSEDKKPKSERVVITKQVKETLDILQPDIVRDKNLSLIHI